MHPLDPEEEGWEALDAFLRSVSWPEPDPGLRDRCLPSPSSSGFRVLSSGLPNSELGTQNSELTVLVVDDEPHIRRLVQFHLSRAGYHVLTAADGLEALAMVRQSRPDLVVLDVTMPGPDGFQVVQALKDDPQTAWIPVVMLTGRDALDHVRQGSLAGADVYMTKPFDPEELRVVIDRLAAVLGTPEEPPPLRRWPK